MGQPHPGLWNLSLVNPEIRLRRCSRSTPKLSPFNTGYVRLTLLKLTSHSRCKKELTLSTAPPHHPPKPLTCSRLGLRPGSRYTGGAVQLQGSVGLRGAVNDMSRLACKSGACRGAQALCPLPRGSWSLASAVREPSVYHSQLLRRIYRACVCVCVCC